jgi:hypothetical protein
MHGQLDGAGQPQAPRRAGHRSGESASRRSSADKVILKHVHEMRVLHKELRVVTIGPPTSPAERILEHVGFPFDLFDPHPTIWPSTRRPPVRRSRHADRDIDQRLNDLLIRGFTR